MNTKTYTGKPCKRGHVAPRFKSDGSCTVCKRELRKARRRANPDRSRAEAKAWKDANPEKVKAYTRANSERQREIGRAWYRNNKDRAREWAARWMEKNGNGGRMREIKAQWRAANREWMNEYSVEWRAANPEKVRSYRSGRRARRAGAPGAGVSDTQWSEIQASALGLCIYCGERKPLTQDHIDPLTRGGAHDPSNVVPACISCNSSKGNVPLLLWLATRLRPSFR